jgi:hypothetical protein
MGAATSAEIEAFGEQVRQLADAALERTERLA